MKNENTKTLSFLAAAAAVLLIAWAARPTPPQTDPNSEVGKFIAPDFQDPLAAASMEIIDYDEETATAKHFKVAQVDGVWSLPSHYNYPADGEKQLANAAASLIDLEILLAIPVRPADRELYGVVDPTEASPGAVGVGKRVTLADKSNKKLLELIIGKEVKGQQGLRYVRVPGRDVVYHVRINPNKLTTRFADWIEDDLLKLNAWDIQRIIIDDYTIDERTGERVQKEVVRLRYDDAEAKWSLDDLAEGEELDTSKLNDLKNAIDDLKIVDVRRKPSGLSRDLRTEEGIQLDQQALLSLASRGFYFLQDGYLHSNQGEVVVTMKDGVEYVLRFGEIARGTETAEAEGAAEGEEGTDGEESETAPSSGPNRYLFVTAAFNPDVIPKPELEPLPEAPAEQSNGAEAEGEGEAADGAAATEDENAGDDAAEETAGVESSDEASTDEADSLAADGAAASEDENAGDDDTAEEADSLAAERKRIEQENQRKQSEYEKKLEEGQQRVKELNDRFADWYYVISNDVFEKIHLSRSQVIAAAEPGEATGEGDTPADFDVLRGGLPPSGDEAEEMPADEAPAETPADDASDVAPSDDDASSTGDDAPVEPAEEEAGTEEAPPAEDDDASAGEEQP